MQRFLILVPFLFLLASCKSQPRHKTELVINNYHFKPLDTESKEKYAAEIKPLYKKMLIDRGFNGSILVAKNGQIVFEDYHGIYNWKTRDSITPETPVQLASVSKTFTAAVILHLWEQGKLNLDDTVAKYLKGFPYSSITIKELLCHRSGLANYAYFMERSGRRLTYIQKRNKKGRIINVAHYISNTDVPMKKYVTNEDMLDYIIKYKPAPEAMPNRGFYYSNTNFALLALIAERITKIPFPKYMRDSVFTPLGMTHSYIFNIADTDKYVPSYNYNNYPFPLERFDCIYGDKNVYSTVRDLLQWDRALSVGSFIKQETLDLAYQPFSDERKRNHFYGLGWHLLIDANETIAYHNGWWHGNNAVFTRILDDNATLIILGNKFNKSIYQARAMSSIFSGKDDSMSVDEQP